MISAISIGLDGTIACNALTLPVYDSVAMVWSEGTSPESLHGHIPDSPDSCGADIDGNGIVDVADLLALIDSWGPCE